MSSVEGPGRCPGCKRSLGSPLSWVGEKRGEPRRCVDATHIDYLLAHQPSRSLAVAVGALERMAKGSPMVYGFETIRQAVDALAKIKELGGTV